MVKRPPWTRDESILALDLYRRVTPPPGKTSNEVRELSDLLRSMRPMLSAEDPDYRNVNGVYMKLMNMRSIDDEVEGKGLDSASQTDREVMDEFGRDTRKLRKTADRIRTAIASASLDLDQADAGLFDEDEVEAHEGRVLTYLHKVRERDPKLRAKAISATMKKSGRLQCEGCSFDFEIAYGDRGRGYIEVHHTEPLHQADPDGRKTRVRDLALVCANCHRMIHRTRPWLSIAELRAIIRLPRA